MAERDVTDQKPPDAPRTATVVLPVFNGEATIGDTINSVIGQTFEDFELLVINDGSTDDTRSIVEGVLDDRLKLFNFENRGLAASRNRGIKKSKAKLIAFIDADDIWMADKLQHQIDKITANQSAGLVYSWTDFIDEKGQFLNRGSRSRVEGDVFRTLLTDNFVNCGSNPLIRKSVFDDVGMFDETVNAAADWDMWLRIANKYSFTYYPAADILYRIHSGSMSYSIRRQELQCKKVLASAIELLPSAEERERIRPAVDRNLYLYMTAHTTRMADSADDFKIAFGYLRKFWASTPTRARDLPQAILLLIKMTVNCVLPKGMSILLFRCINRMRGRTGNVSSVAN
jgi:glycosyltransferase involved in cell wall biosynthesis